MSYGGRQTTAIEDLMNIKREKPKKKTPKKKQSELFKKDKKELSPAMLKKLKEHSKMHKGGMSSKHMKNMVKFMKEGMSFSKAHSKAKALDKK